MLTGALRQLFALSEAYPDLKANQNFLTLQEELTSTEDRIAYARQFYNDSVQKYNNKIQTIPSNIIAGMFGFKRARVLQGRRRGTPRGAEGPVLSPSTLRPYPSSRCTSRSPRTSARRFFLIFGFVAARARGRVPRSTTCLQAASVGIVIVAVIVDRLVDRVVLQQRQGRARDEPRAVPPIRTQYARYHNLVEGLCIASGLPKPRLYIIDDAAPNAFATGRNPKHAAIAVTTGLLEKMNRVELEGVLAHELSHIRNYDILVMTLAVTMVGIIALLSDFFLRFMFLGGGASATTTTATTRSAIVFMIVGFVLLIFAPIIARAHAVRGEPEA